jgi:adenylate cyclase
LKPVIEKTRHLVTHENHLWEIDEFDGENAGLIVAEIELEAVGESFSKPDWIGAEVTQDVRYYNNNLAREPYCKWRDDV